MTEQLIVSHYLSSSCTITDTAKALGVSYTRAYRAIANSPDVPKRLIQDRRSLKIKNARLNRASPKRALTEDDARSIYEMLKQGVLQKQIAEKFGAERSVISRMKRGETYHNYWKKYYQ